MVRTTTATLDTTANISFKTHNEHELVQTTRSLPYESGILYCEGGMAENDYMLHFERDGGGRGSEW
jgi:hypothetical protein